MNKMRKAGSLSHFSNEFLSASKGAVSILLMIVTTPFLALTLFLVESVRYQDTLELVFELEDLVATSTLANYDEFLNDRFGLLAVDQTTALQERYDEYMDANIQSYKNEVEMKTVTATGMFPLSETDVFEQQVIDNCEITGIVEVVFEALDLDKLFEKLNSVTDLSKIKNISDTGSQVMDVLDALKQVYFDLEGNYSPDTGDGETYMRSLAELEWDYKYYKGEVEDYYPAFQEKFKAYCDALATARANCEPGEDPHDDPDVISAYNELYWPKYYYRSALVNCRDAYKAYSDRIQQTMTDIAAIDDAMNGDDDSEYAAFIEKVNAFIDAVQAVTSESNTYIEYMTGDQVKFSTVVSDIDNINNTNFSEVSWNDTKITDTYKIISNISTYADSAYTIFENAVDFLDGIFDEEAQENTAGISDYLSLFKKLRSVTCFYNSCLNSNVNEDDWAVPVGADPGFEDFMEAIGLFTSACQDVVDGLKSLNIIKIIKAAVKIVKAMVKLTVSIIEYITKFVDKIIDLISSATSHPDGVLAGFISYLAGDLLVSSYACYNFSNRTNYLKESKLLGKKDEPGRKGYSYKYDGNKELSNTFAGDFSAFASVMSGTHQPSNNTRFLGAELEYILIGLENECQNQLCAFIDIYLFRMALDLPAIFKDTAIRSLATSYPPFTLAVYLLVILVEPFLDTFLLVNAGTVPFVKGEIFLSAKGLFTFLQKFIQATNTMSEMAKIEGVDKDQFEKDLTACIGEQDSSAGMQDCPLDVTYTENILILLLLSVGKDTKLKRMQNLVQMEAKTKDANFELSKAYTYIKADANCSMKPMLNVGFSNNGIIDVSNTRYLGY